MKYSWALPLHTSPEAQARGRAGKLTTETRRTTEEMAARSRFSLCLCVSVVPFARRSQVRYGASAFSCPLAMICWAVSPCRSLSISCSSFFSPLMAD